MPFATLSQHLGSLASTRFIVCSEAIGAVILAWDFWQQFDQFERLEELRQYRPALYRALPEPPEPAADANREPAEPPTARKANCEP